MRSIPTLLVGALVLGPLVAACSGSGKGSAATSSTSSGTGGIATAGPSSSGNGGGSAASSSASASSSSSTSTASSASSTVSSASSSNGAGGAGGASSVGSSTASSATASSTASSTAGSSAASSSSSSSSSSSGALSCNTSAAGGTVVWSTNIGLKGVGGPTAMTAELGTLVVGSQGDAIVGSPWWSTASVGQVGLVGVQLYDVSPSGTVTTLEDVGVSQADTTSNISTSLAVAGATNWTVQVRAQSAASFYVTTAGLPNGPGAPAGPLSLGASMDALGNSFVVGSGQTPDYIQKLDSTAKSVWGLPSANATSWLGVPYACNQATPECWAFVAPDGLGGVVVPGFNTTAADYGCGPITGAFIMRLGPTGACVWSEPAPQGAPPTYTFSLLPAGNGEVFVTGSYLTSFSYFGCPKLTSTAAASSYVAKLDGAGSCVWASSFDVPTLTATASFDGDIVVESPFTGTIDFGGKTLTSVGKADLAVARFSGATGVARWNESFGAPGAAIAFGRGAAGDAMGGAAMLVIASAPVDFGGGPVSGATLVKLESGGVFGWQAASFTGQAAIDPCGAVITATTCTTPCTPGGPGFTVQKLAP